MPRRALSGQRFHLRERMLVKALMQFRSVIFRRIFFAILALAMAPALVLGWVAVQSGISAGEVSISLSRAALDDRARETLELRAVETASRIAAFLQEREGDLRLLAGLPPDEEVYRAFLDSHQGELWRLEDGAETRTNLPLYVEIAYLTPDGAELVRATPQETFAYPDEPWLEETLSLPEGEIYVGHLNGYHVDAEQLAAGTPYRGILRFAMPVYTGSGELAGAVTLALDFRHVQEFVVHIVPDDTRYAVVPDASTGSYAYLIDDRSYTLAHPNQTFLYGVTSDGEELPYVSAPEHLGLYPVRLDQIGFLDENLASIPALAAQGQAGSIRYIWQEKDKITAYAPVPYYGGSYDPPAGFGWLGVGSEVGTYYHMADQVGSGINEKVRSLVLVAFGVLVLGGIASLPIAGRLASSVAAPIQRITEAARRVQDEEYELEILDPLVESESKDEIAVLARVIKQMALKVFEREVRLRQVISRLKIEIDETKKRLEVSEVVETEYFKDLEKKVKEIRKRRDEEG